MNNEMDSLNLEFNDYLSGMREYASLNNIPIIKDEGLAFIATLLNIKKPKNILEIGTAIGYSAAMFHKISNSYVTTIEKNDIMYEEAIKNIGCLGYDKYIRVIFQDALLAFDKVNDIKYDCIFIDAAKGQYKNFFELYKPLLAENGVIICDNMLFHGLVKSTEEAKSRQLRALIRKIRDFHSYILCNSEFDSRIFDIGDGISVSIKK